MRSGIYMIENTVSGMRYIGQSDNISKRWAQHRSDLRGNRHDNDHLQKAFNKYGEGAFVFRVLEEVPVKDLDAAEIRWIECYDTYKNGYNMTKGGEATRGLTPWNKGKPRSERIRKILSESAKKRTGEKNPFFNKKHTAETKQKISAMRSIPVREVETGIVYPSAKAADEAHGGHSSNVSKALNGDCPRAYGLHWEYAR